MKLGPIIDQLQGLGFINVLGAVEFAGMAQVPTRLPAAFVVPESDDAAASRNAAYVIDQRVDEVFAVVIVLNAATRGTGAKAAAASEELNEICDTVRDRLVGWMHPEAEVPTQYVGGRLLSADGTALTWALRFRTSYHLRKVV